jgi:predicted molibdopterin-dependent oxidoreductase YjgC
MKIIINNKEVEVVRDETLIETARREGFAIPSMCYAKGHRHLSSCMVCAVKDMTTGRIMPSCTTVPTAGMNIDTESSEVISSRRLSLELLLSDHRADCQAPCSLACPGNMDVATMNRLCDEGKSVEALALLRDTLTIPAILCFICTAPCEKVCRKGSVNHVVAVREIKKSLVLQTDLNNIVPTDSNDRQIAIVGSDPAALATAYHLRKLGYQITVFEPAGQILTPYIAANSVPKDILELEIEVIKRMGVKFVYSSEYPSDDKFDKIVPQSKPKQPARMTLDGKRLAIKIHSSFASDAATLNEPKMFNSVCGRFNDNEVTRLNRAASTATNCLYCDCDGKFTCLLRRYATEYGIRNIRYTKDGAALALDRRKIGEHIVFEPAKCIKCGLCVYNSDNGFTFQGRGFTMQVALPDENIINIHEQIIELCPTSALYSVC